MRYYIEALNAKGEPILGNMNGQIALKALQPMRCKAWTRLFQPASPTRPRWERVERWRLVTPQGKVIAEHINPYWSQS
jgi:hypothetical protein